ncbi:MAG: hypothetical protein KIT62_04340 [Cyclobacteriaceae bacterium]|nr:hypothetical protein [Cyclobacteriaceae bacterium]
MKIKVFLLTVFVTMSIALNSCYQNELSPAREHTIGESADDTRSLVIELSSNDILLKSLYSSDEWLSMSNDVKKRIANDAPITLTKFKNSDIEIISYKLITEANYESLVFYTYQGLFLSAIAKSENKSKFKHLSLSATNGKIYYDFYVNDEGKLGKLKVHNGMSFGNKIKNNNSSKTSSVEDTCPNTSSTFGDCMLCAIEECSDDWVCAVVCSIMSPSCLAGFALACLTGDYAPQP